MIIFNCHAVVPEAAGQFSALIHTTDLLGSGLIKNYCFKHVLFFCFLKGAGPADRIPRLEFSCGCLSLLFFFSQDAEKVPRSRTQDGRV